MSENTENTQASDDPNAAAAAAEVQGAGAQPAPDAPLTPAQKAAATRAAKAANAAAAPAQAEVAVPAPSGVKRVKIILEENDAIPPGGQFFGVNGTGYQIIPGKEVLVPEFLLGVIDNAVTTKPVLNEDSQVVGYRDVPRFPYRIVK